MARPLPPKDGSRRALIVVLGVGSCIVLGLVAAGVMILLRGADASNAPAPTAVALLAPAPSATPRLEPGSVLANARREASAWRHDAVLVSFSASPLDARGVAPGGKVEATYAQPNGQRITGGAEAGGQRLVLTTTEAGLAKSEEHAGKSRIAPEPNCLFEDAWASARRAGADVNASLGLRYAWNEKQARPIWEVITSDGQVLRRLDGVSCSILTR